MNKFILPILITCWMASPLTAFQMNLKTIDPQSIRENPEYKKLDKVDKGHYKTLINMSDMPNDKSFTVTNDRPLVKSRNIVTVENFKKEDLTVAHMPDGSLAPCFVVSGKGFLPGEKIRVNFQCEGEEPSSIILHPNPLYDWNDNCDALVIADLINMKPTVYELTAKGLKNGEKLEFVNVVGKSQDTLQVIYDDSKPMRFIPNIKKGFGGTSHLTIVRENGEVFELYLPFGMELTRYSQGKISPRA